MQEKQFFLNMKKGKLHITGYCKESKIKPYDIQYFDSEDEALAVMGRAMSVCKVCSKKRDKLLQVAKEERK